jgi:pilus assembly protein FimV
MAYGLDAQAEEILKDAITKEPKRYELHLKLLEMYAASKNVSAFETISGELYTTLGADDPTWAKVAEIGIKLEPNNPLYQVNSHPTGVAKADELGLDIGASETKIEMFAANDVSDAKDGNTIDFEMGDSNMDDLGSAEPTATPSIEEPIKTPVEEFSYTMPSLDIPTFAAPQFMPDVFAEDVSEKADELPMLSELTAESFEFPQVEEAPAEEPTAEGVLDISGATAKFAETEASDANDLNFDVPTITPEASSMGKNLSEASIYDLSSINLDLNDDVASNSAEHSFEVGGASEPIEVDIKLELVTAYIEMDDKEGAKELLAEVMKEGGATQRQRAEALLEKIA